MNSKILVTMSIATSLAVVPAAYATNEHQFTLAPLRTEHGSPLDNEFARIVLSSWSSSETQIDARPVILKDDDDEGYEAGIRSRVSRLWAEDWDSDEDSVYDTW